jgi:hypothetical protein
VHGSYDAGNGTIHLSWDAPDAAHDYTYTVSRNGQELATVDALNYTDSAPAAANYYTVTAQVDSPGDSATPPSGGSGPGLISIVVLECNPIVLATTWTFPFVDYELYPECIPLPP